MILELVVLASSYCDARISNGSRMNCNAITAASRDIPIGTCISVGKVVIRINDIGPCSSSYCQKHTPHILKRKLDLSYGAVRAIGYKHPYLGKVKYKVVECK